ncbi:MAG: 16S rRNA (cytosine(1402)-N(4))-methyltransferase RsmH [Deltaproteobacteria bacterium]|nr:16S rRNA (cytosine(1402)-N(4))-methyltransferase RsmH [Deltaproteobacteria bacterium]
MVMNTTENTHIPVLVGEVLEALSGVREGLVADVTVGLGGHAEAVLDAHPGVTVLGLDRDPAALERASRRLARFGDRVELRQATFSTLWEALGGRRAAGLVADLGVSSLQLDDPSRGMSFRAPGPLDMRMGPDAPESAEELLRSLSTDALADVLYQYGEERASRPIARAIKKALDEGRLTTTRQLAECVYRVLGPPRFGRLDPATRTFQALRIAVNRELDELEALVRGLPEVLEDHGVAAVISFHSLEDRIVKHGLRALPSLEVRTRKPRSPTEEEARGNPRARSAKLRVAHRRPRGGGE